MCSLKTLASAAVCNLAALGAPAFAGQSLDLAREFANCTGRYSALMEHEWLMGTTGAGATRARRNAFAELVAAVAAPDNGPRLLAWRIEAKAAQARLLQHAAFATDPAARDTAERRAAGLIAACDQLMLGS